MLMEVTCTHNEQPLQKKGKAQELKYDYNSSIICAVQLTFVKNLYLICSDVPFVFVCARVVKRSLGAKQREHKEIIDGDRCSVTPEGGMVVIFK